MNQSERIDVDTRAAVEGWYRKQAIFLSRQDRDDLARALSCACMAAVEREREECAVIHEMVDVSEGVDPMAVAIEYRDRIRERSNG